MSRLVQSEQLFAAMSTESKYLDLFVSNNYGGWPIKDDLASMEIPLFSLSKKTDTATKEYRRGNKVVRVIPSAAGAATIYDKDLLIYIASLFIDAQNQGKPVSKTFQINSIDFLTGTKRGDGSASYGRILDMLRRLRGTTIETNIPTNGIVQTEGFSLIDSYKIISEKAGGRGKRSHITDEQETCKAKVLCFSVTISDWLFNGLLNNEVLTIHDEYFQLRATDRRLYEIARKHCGLQPMFKINIALLAEKIAMKRSALFKIRDEIRDTIKEDRLPEYHIALDPLASPDDVIFYTRDRAKLTKELIRINGFKWYESLERYDNFGSWRHQQNYSG